MPFVSPSSSAEHGDAQARPTTPGHWPTFLLVVVGALGLFIGQPNQLFHLPILALCFPFSLYLLSALAPTDTSAFLRCWLLGLAGNTAGLYWLVNPLHDVGGLGYELAVPGAMLMSGYLACYAAFAGFGMRRLRRLFSLPIPGFAPDSARSATASLLQRLAPSSLLAGLAYAGFEVLCGTLFTGFPWLSLSSAFALRPAWVQAASITGGYGLSACFAFCACLGAAALLARTRSESACAALLALVLTAALPAYGGIRLSRPLPESATPPVSVLMVQGNIDQNQKWLPEFQEATLEHYLSLSKKGMGLQGESLPDKRPDLLLWPETAMPFYFQAQPELTGRLRRFAAFHNVNLAFGSLGVETGRLDGQPVNLLHNRLFLLSASGMISGIYDKQHLVPFGEYIPFASSLAFLRNITQGLDFTPGSTVRPLSLALPEVRPDPLADAPHPSQTGNETGVSTPFDPVRERRIPLGVLICYEAIFPYMAQDRVAEGAELLVNVSNDGWCGRTSAPLQHLGLTAMRAVEQARPIARATNTGYTTAIDSRGRLTVLGERLFTENTYFAILQPSNEITVYHRIHPIPEILLVALALFSLFGYTLRRSTFRSL